MEKGGGGVAGVNPFLEVSQKYLNCTLAFLFWLLLLVFF